MSVLPKAEAFVFQLFKDKLSTSYTYHNFTHTLQVIQGVKELIENENLSIEESLLVELAAWFHDTGYIEGCKNHEERSAEIAKDFMATEGFSIEQQLKVASIILATEAQSEPKTVLEKFCEMLITNISLVNIIYLYVSLSELSYNIQ